MDCVYDSLEYVRRARPKAVVIENVNEDSIVGPLTEMLSMMGGYRLRHGMLDPRKVAKARVARERHFWVMVRTD